MTFEKKSCFRFMIVFLTQKKKKAELYDSSMYIV